MRTTLALLFMAILGPGLVADPAPATLRIDYFHTGNAGQEIFSLEQVVREPLAFPGNPDRPIDATLRGKYLAEAREAGSDEVFWSRSFSSIYGEWETTAEAKERHRSFHESVRLPDPGRVFDLVIRKRDDQYRFREVWRIGIDPADYLVHEESAMHAADVVALRDNGDPAHKVDLLILGDGYTAGETDAFLARARELTDALFATSPFRERESDFNVWALAPASRQSGISRPSTGVYRDSPLGTRYDAFRSERYVLTMDNKAFRRVASSAPYDFVEILTNSEVYGGGGIYGLYATAAANSAWAVYLVVHEFGHHFAGLADEYYTSDVAYEAPATVIEPYEPNITALLEPEQLKWRHLVTPGTPLPTPWPKAAYEEHALAYQAERRKMRAENVPEAEMNALFARNQEFVEGLFAESGLSGVVGAFEGAGYQALGLYRSEQDCLMFTRSEQFCRVCAAAIEDIIDAYTEK